jgi:hypothetical protein
VSDDNKQTAQQYTLPKNLTWQQPSHFEGGRSIVATLVNVVVDLDDNFPLRQVVCKHVHDLFETLHKCVVIMEHLLVYGEISLGIRAATATRRKRRSKFPNPDRGHKSSILDGKKACLK